MPDDKSTIQEGELIEEPGGTVSAPLHDPAVNPAATTLDLTGLINTHLDQIQTIKEQMNKLRDMLQAIYENDPTYQMHDAAVKEATRVRSQTKKQIQKLPQAADLTNQIQNLKSHIKELTQTMSEYLQDYARTTGSTSFETTDGQVREIVYVAKLVSRSQPKEFR